MSIVFLVCAATVQCAYNICAVMIKKGNIKDKIGVDIVDNAKLYGAVQYST